MDKHIKDKQHLLLKYISSCNEEGKNEDAYVNDFLKGHLYMNTVSYFWDPLIRSYLIKEHISCNPNLDNSKLYKELESLLKQIGAPPQLNKIGQYDSFEGTISIAENGNFTDSKKFGEHTLIDPAYRSIGFGYCNICCFYRLDYSVEYINGYKLIKYNPSNRMNGFGKNIVIIKEEEEFLRRIHKAVSKLGYKYLCGNVIYHKQYKDGKEAEKRNSITVSSEDLIVMENDKKIINRRSCFDKMDDFKWQNEYRIALYRGVKDPNAYTLDIGDIRDICEVTNYNNVNRVIDNILRVNPKLGLSDYYGNISREKLIDLFYKLGDNNVQLLTKLG